MNLEELKQVQEKAHLAYYEASEAKEYLHNQKIKAAIEIINRELKPMSDKVLQLSLEAREAKQAVEDELVRLAKEGNRHKYAVGTKLKKIETVYRRWGSTEPSTVEKYGILEVVGRDTQFPLNTASYNRPSIGSFIVRVCNQDGKPGKKFEEWRDYRGWVPVEEINETPAI